MKLNVKRKLDKLWSDKVKDNAGWKCEMCGKISSLNSHHLFSRSYMSTRFDLKNGIALCVSCHFKAHKRSLEFSEWVIRNRGRRWFNKLKEKSQEIGRYIDAKEVEESLK